MLPTDGRVLNSPPVFSETIVWPDLVRFGPFLGRSLSLLWLLALAGGGFGRLGGRLACMTVEDGMSRTWAPCERLCSISSRLHQPPIMTYTVCRVFS